MASYLLGVARNRGVPSGEESEKSRASKIRSPEKGGRDTTAQSAHRARELVVLAGACVARRPNMNNQVSLHFCVTRARLGARFAPANAFTRSSLR